MTAYYRHKKFDGQIWWLYILSYAAMRFVVEFFRGDYDVHYAGIFTLGQIVAVVMIAVALAGWKLCRRSA